MPIAKPKLNPNNKATTLKSIPPKKEAKPSIVKASGNNFSEYDSVILREEENSMPIKVLGMERRSVERKNLPINPAEDVRPISLSAKKE